MRVRVMVAAGFLLSVPAFGTAQVSVFAETPGHQEFSGRMIARPAQRSELRARGMTMDEAESVRDRARELVALFEITEYVPQTDEYLLEVPDGAHENDVADALLPSGAFDYVHPDWIVFPLVCPDGRAARPPVAPQRRSHGLVRRLGRRPRRPERDRRHL